MHSRKRVRESTLKKSWAPAPQSTWHPPQTPPPTSRRLLLASFSLPARRLLCNTTPAHHPGFECSTASVPANRVGGKQALGWWQINCRVRKRRESASEAACILSPNYEYLSAVLLRTCPTTSSALCASHSEGAIRGPALPQRNEAQQPANQGWPVGTQPAGGTAVEEGMLSSVRKARAVARASFAAVRL